MRVENTVLDGLLLNRNSFDMKCGVIYVAIGKRFLSECHFSAKSLRRNMPKLSITLFTDEIDIANKKLFNSIIPLEGISNPHKSKINAIINTPYQNTLYIDTDTKILKPLYEIFEFLKIYDLGISPRIKCDYTDPKETKFIDYIDSKHYNTGVIVYKKSVHTQSFFRRWLEVASDHNDDDMRSGHFGDQHFFNKLIFEEKYHLKCNMNYFLMPNTIYNARLWLWQQAKKDKLYKYIKILHAHGLDERPIKIFLRKLKHKYLGRY